MIKFRDNRKSKNISQVEMAQKLNIPVSTYNVYENGNRKVRGDSKEYSKILNVEVKDIFCQQLQLVKSRTI